MPLTHHDIEPQASDGTECWQQLQLHRPRISSTMPDSGTEDTSKPLAVSLAKRRPPPEKEETLRIRTLIVLSFWAVIIFLGLPTWWKTTTIYRAKLPLSEMMDWADGRVGVYSLELSAASDQRRLADLSFLCRSRSTRHLLQSKMLLTFCASLSMRSMISMISPPTTSGCSCQKQQSLETRRRLPRPGKRPLLTMTRSH